MKKPELLAPAGNLEKLKVAILYGADAVYCGGHQYGLREGADNFSLAELAEGTEFAHRYGRKIYLTVNMIPHNDDLIGLPDYLKQLQALEVDGLIIADPGVLYLLQAEGIELPVHLSTQANAVNWASIRFWKEQGIERVILARELSQEEISEIREKTELELEIFIHGSNCISYSGRCLLSNYLVNRDANRGKCAHSCRWKYYLVEEKRPGEYYPITEDEQGSYIMNSKDLCLLEYLPEIINMGIDSLKIEGRMKSLHYVANVTRVYRRAIDAYLANPAAYRLDPLWWEELKKINQRDYTTAFFSGPPTTADHNYHSSAYQRGFDFMGMIKEYRPEKGEATVEVRHKLVRGDLLEIIGFDGESFTQRLDYLLNEAGEQLESAPHPRQLIRIPVDRPVQPYYLVRRERYEPRS